MDLPNRQDFLIIPTIAATGGTQIDGDVRFASDADPHGLVPLIRHRVLALRTGCVFFRLFHRSSIYSAPPTEVRPFCNWHCNCAASIDERKMYSDLTDINDLNAGVLDEIEQFFENYQQEPGHEFRIVALRRANEAARLLAASRKHQKLRDIA